MMTTLENAVSRRAERSASAGSPDTEAYGDQPTTSSVNSVLGSTEALPTSVSSAFNSTSLRESLIAAPRCRSRSVQTRGPSPWPPRILRLRARPRCATARGVRSRRPDPPEAAHIAPGPGRQVACCAGALRLLRGLPAPRVHLSLVVSNRRSGNERPAPCPSSESHGELLSVRSAKSEALSVSIRDVAGTRLSAIGSARVAAATAAATVAYTFSGPIFSAAPVRSRKSRTDARGRATSKRIPRSSSVCLTCSSASAPVVSISYVDSRSRTTAVGGCSAR